MTDHLTDATANYIRAIAKHACETPHPAHIGYTQNLWERWVGIRDRLWYPRFPDEADCSSMFTYWVANGRVHVRGKLGVDVVNGLNWKAGNTATAINHGAKHSSLTSCRLYKPGRTGIFYADSGSVSEHMTLFLGDIIWNSRLNIPDLGSISTHRRNGMLILEDVVASHGREQGPEIQPWNYRRRVGANAYAV